MILKNKIGNTQFFVCRLFFWPKLSKSVKKLSIKFDFENRVKILVHFEYFLSLFRETDVDVKNLSTNRKNLYKTVFTFKGENPQSKHYIQYV